MSSELLRFIDSIHREKDISKEVLFDAIESTIAAAIKKKYEIEDGDLELKLDRQTGEILSNYEIKLPELGRIFAQTVKQAIQQKLREAERDVVYVEYEQKQGDIISGTVQRFEGDTVIVNLGKVEGILPKAEKVRGENYHIGERIRALLLEVKKAGPKVKVILSRGHKDLVRRLFQLEVPEIAEGIIEIRKVEREPGYRTKLAVTSRDPKIDCVGACVGVRGTRIKAIIDELNGEKIDIIRWNDDPESLIQNALKPATIGTIELDHERRKALVLVEEDQLSLAIGRKGQNVRLASKLCGWDIDIMTRAELEATIANDEKGPKAEDAAAASAAGAGVDPAATASDKTEPTGSVGTIDEPETDTPELDTSAASPTEGAAEGGAGPGDENPDKNSGEGSPAAERPSSSDGGQATTPSKGEVRESR
jgi:N utilization substance protein A